MTITSFLIREEVGSGIVLSEENKSNDPDASLSCGHL
jgi:hypothetical protein